MHWGRSNDRLAGRCTRASSRRGYRRPLLSFLLALNDGGWCTVPVTDRIDPLTALQGRRIALQARSRTFAYIGSRIGWWVSAFTSQIDEPDGGERKATSNLKSLISERGAIRRIARAFLSPPGAPAHLLPGFGWFIAQ